ncbi:fumarylacetoacetate (FAA) hydrolase [Leadbetterella byssophila DSM 17132]|uniref:Fumarylacetoacetate (FAA) hydrolase n=1 Tax=Leadbetterella byssophila (strain DSM 17132 / JCM 16389 / KACC 11308 / NBRC 106382 / 4M15) TaxID=649349 RepID=E4RWV7_LEAB4|nr:fumarylacetoacetate hydrolase family protein [Leadbetterella byssophila]ADQ17163.1 fumarylacetoacetate (FAA) hydrolase [Leadbetterella byssophila DSM 17132]
MDHTSLKLYRTERGIVAQENQTYYLLEETDWDKFINDDELYEKTRNSIKNALPINETGQILSPVSAQELWACGVTYLRSKQGRQEESKDGGDIYARVYDAERPEVFFKGNTHRISAPGRPVRIRKDSGWDVPEPELTLLASSSGKIIGYTIGNDMSSRSIEGENPLYLPQAKTFDGCASVGPCILVMNQAISRDAEIQLSILRDSKEVFFGSVQLNQMKRGLEELVGYVYKECSFPHGAFIMTGTGIVPDHDFTLNSGDLIRISISGIGTLENPVA